LKEKKFCSFCGKSEDLVKKLIKGRDGSCICDECVLICGDMVKESDAEAAQSVPLKTPAEIKEARQIHCRSARGKKSFVRCRLQPL